MIPVILSGGSGTRLWPASRAHLPKQFCHLFNETLHASTIKRLKPLSNPWIITSQSLRDLTLRDAKSFNIPTQQIIFEPIGRNTAPAIALLCHFFAMNNLMEEVVGFFPADHLIENETHFYQAITMATQEAEKGSLVLLGIKPDFPATGYGYIQLESPSKELTSTLTINTIYPVAQFHEKPTLEKAQEFLSAGNYFWNAGIFIFKVKTMIEALEQHYGNDWNLIKQIKLDGSNLLEIYNQVKSISIDYAILEKLNKTQLRCIPCDVGWSDVGSWDALSEIMGTTSNKKIEIQSQNNFIHASSTNADKKYVFIDTDELIVVDTEDAMLISKKGSTQSVKEAVDQLKAINPQLTKDHTYEFRPWGQYQILRNESHFKSKVLQVLPQEQLSYQSHSKREEHWIFTRGRGEVVLNDEVIPVKAGSYVHIPLQAKHRIRNTSTEEVLELVEVQLGAYFGEDDIVRYQDDYQRSQ